MIFAATSAEVQPSPSRTAVAAADSARLLQEVAAAHLSDELNTVVTNTINEINAFALLRENFEARLSQYPPLRHRFDDIALSPEDAELHKKMTVERTKLSHEISKIYSFSEIKSDLKLKIDLLLDAAMSTSVRSIYP